MPPGDRLAGELTGPLGHVAGVSVPDREEPEAAGARRLRQVLLDGLPGNLRHQCAVHMDTPVEQIVRRGRAVRARRRLPGVAGAAAAVAGAVLAGTTLLPAGHPSGVRLAAWTVTRQANGTIKVTIRELRDPAGLQSKLRADGIPASVTFSSKPNPACQEYPGKWDLNKAGVQSPSSGPYVLTIHPSALPRGAGVQIGGKFDFEYTLPGRPGMIYITP